MKSMVLVVGALITSMFLAQDVEAAAAQCEGCSASQMRTKAVSLGEGVHVISSLSSATIMSFRVDPNPDGNPVWIVKPKAVPYDVQQNFEGALELYAVGGISMQSAVVINADDLDGVAGLEGKSAYDVMTDINLKGRIADRLANGTLPGVANLDRAAEQLTNWGFSKVGLAPGASIEIKLVYSDGTTTVFSLQGLQSIAEYEKGRSRTPNGQVIPEENSPENQGNWTSSGGDNISDLANHMDRIGANLVFLSPPGTVATSMACTWEGTTLTCKLE